MKYEIIAPALARRLFGASPDFTGSPKKFDSGGKVLWDALRGETLPELRFRSQHAWETFIFDFYCPKHRLIVEVDGGYHDLPDQIEKDQLRDVYLSNLGFKTLRFRNEEIFSDLPGVLERIKNHAVLFP